MHLPRLHDNAHALVSDDLSLVGEVEIRGRTGTLSVWTIWPADAKDRRATH